MIQFFSRLWYNFSITISALIHWFIRSLGTVHHVPSDVWKTKLPIIPKRDHCRHPLTSILEALGLQFLFSDRCGIRPQCVLCVFLDIWEKALSQYLVFESSWALWRPNRGRLARRFHKLACLPVEASAYILKLFDSTLRWNHWVPFTCHETCWDD